MFFDGKQKRIKIEKKRDYWGAKSIHNNLFSLIKKVTEDTFLIIRNTLISKQTIFIFIYFLANIILNNLTFQYFLHLIQSNVHNQLISNYFSSIKTMANVKAFDMVASKMAQSTTNGISADNFLGTSPYGLDRSILDPCQHPVYVDPSEKPCSNFFQQRGAIDFKSYLRLK